MLGCLWNSAGSNDEPIWKKLQISEEFRTRDKFRIKTEFTVDIVNVDNYTET